MKPQPPSSNPYGWPRFLGNRFMVRLWPSLHRHDTLRMIGYHLAVADVLTKQQRSKLMAAVRSCGNKSTEVKLASMLRAAGITGWRRHQPLPGRPDFTFRFARLAVFVDGCFWHGCRWHCRMPKSRTAFWKLKIASNKKRARVVRSLLRQQGWRVLRLWEHSLADPVRTLDKLQGSLASYSGKS
jgi:DNA mismatch endonuclease, patch repair protein